MEKELTNGENVENLRKREKLRIGMLIFSFLTVVFAVLDIIFSNTMFLVLAIICFIVANILKRKREKTIIKRRDDYDKKIENIIKSSEKEEKKKKKSKNKAKP